MDGEAAATSVCMNQTGKLSWLGSNASWSFPERMEEEEDANFFSDIGIENFITLIVFGLIFALGVLGNSLVITVLARSKSGKPRSTTNIFILNLSIADLAYLLFCIPFQSTVYMLPNWVLGTFICKFTHYFFTVSMLVSIFTLSAMSVDRYVAIVHSRRSSSLRVSRNALFGVGAIWLLSIAMASPVAHHQRIVYKEIINQTFCWEVWPDLHHKQVYVICTFVFGYLLPLLLISFCYAKVINHLHKKLRNISKKSEASKKKTAQTVLVVVVVFGISWLPHHVVHLWAEFGDFPLTQASFLFRITAHCLAYSNSSVNPIIYAFLSENFRKAYKQVFKCQIGNKSSLNEVKESKNSDKPSTKGDHMF
ncbi:galanin receptor type 1 isoform X2 [Hemicordylus capensis]|uniref:galanin receptor type 1 isoform X2 n=1 Tax=Hemicordylus capensis TaxID=884348 RepID=UPI0023038232|nr:galanin receptor type 1 isoform X2 [Hemicordylus capensis]